MHSHLLRLQIPKGAVLCEKIAEVTGAVDPPPLQVTKCPAPSNKQPQIAIYWCYSYMQ
jgi:hypothetical protein